MLRFFALMLVSTAIGACTPEGKPPIYTSFVQGEIGGTCETNDDCKEGLCFTNGFAGLNGAQYAAVGGYCSKLCTVDAECGSGKCVQGFDGKRYCMAHCDAPNRCRAGLICRPNKHCEPQNLYVLECDPAQNGGFCTTGNGDVGGCLRNSLGTGPAGECIRTCELGGTCPGTNVGCHYYDFKQAFGDPFQGLLCAYTVTNPAPLGGACSSASQCVSGANCIIDGPDQASCHQLCNEFTFECNNGSSCVNFDPAGPVQVCSF
jgi:hypothetical protein